MRTIFNLFGRSPFAPLKSHMEMVSDAVHLLEKLFSAIDKDDQESAKIVTKEICDKEHSADLIKREIRNNLPKSLFLPIDRSSLLDILTLQDSIADTAEDLAVLLTLKEVKRPSCLCDQFGDFVRINLEAFNGAVAIINEMHDLLESSFGGAEAEKVRNMVDEVAHKEHEADLCGRKLIRELLHADDTLSYTEFFVWQKTISYVGTISNLSENLAYKVRSTLELK